MAGFKAPDFKERAALVNEARQKALEKLKAKPPVDEAAAAERRAARLAREAAEAEKRQAKRAAEEEKKAAKRAAAAELAAAQAEAAAAAVRPAKTEAELKAARDARYAARKQRKK